MQEGLQARALAGEGRVRDHAAREARVGGHGRPVVALGRGLGGRGEQLTGGHGVGAAGDGLGHVAGALDLAVGDDVHVAPAGLVQVVAARGGGVGDGGGHRGLDAQRRRGGVHTGADDHAGRTGAHQVQRGGVVGHAAGDDRHVQGADELLEVERLAALGDVLGGDDGALDDQQLGAGLDHVRGELTGVLRADAHGDGGAGGADLADALGEQVEVHRGGVQLLEHPVGGRGVHTLALGLLRGGDHAVDRAVEVGLTAPQALGVDDAQAALAVHLDDELGPGQRVGRVRHHRDVEGVGVDVPGRVGLLRGAGAPGGHDRDVAQVVGAAGLSPDADFGVVTHWVFPHLRGRRTAVVRTRVYSRPPHRGQTARRRSRPPGGGTAHGDRRGVVKHTEGARPR